MNKYIALLAVILSLTACKDKSDPHAAWLGKWTGPEGTYLDLSVRDDNYAVVVANLDGPITFEGRAVDGGIAFDRDGKTETIKAGDGTATGMKYLEGKKDCLVINSGEGFCRD
jgi:hypothetical protein